MTLKFALSVFSLSFLQLVTAYYDGEIIPNAYIVKLKDSTDFKTHFSEFSQISKEAPELAKISGDAPSGLLPDGPNLIYMDGWKGYLSYLSNETYEAVKNSEDVEEIYQDEVVGLGDTVTNTDSVEFGSIPFEADSFYNVTDIDLETEIVEEGSTLDGYIVGQRLGNAYSNWGLARISSTAKNIIGNLSYIYNSKAGSGTTVYVVDSGIDVYHRDFENRAIMGYNAVSGEEAIDLHGHGTHVAGIVGSYTFGVAKRAKLVGVKVLGASGFGSLSSILAGYSYIHYANQGNLNGVVINYSIGNPGKSPILAQAQSALVSRGAIFVAAAGNSNLNACYSNPGENSDLLIVGNIDIYNRKAQSSNYGTCVDVWAPGTNIWSTYPNGRIQSMTGTSMASPHVAGLAAYYLGLGYNVKQVIQLCKADMITGLITGLTSYDRNVIAFNGAGKRVDSYLA